MTTRLAAVAAVLIAAAAPPARAAEPAAPFSALAAGHGFAAAPAWDAPRARPGSALALAAPAAPATPAGGGAPGLDARRAQILLRSLTVPGWGQATLGRRTAATVFGLIEAGIWGSFVAFQVQDRLRTDSYERTARITAGIDLDGRDEEFRRIVGSFLSSEEYNLYVVARDAANLHYDDPAAMEAYIEAHSLGGADAWAWPDVPSLLRYRDQRKDAQRAQQRANTALAVAVANRLVSALHAARVANRPAAAPTGWRLELAPGPDGDWSGLHLGVRKSF